MDVDEPQNLSVGESFMNQKLTFQAASRRVENSKKSENAREEAQDQIDIFVGTISPLLDPFNIFVRVKDLEESAQFVYFYSYSLGKGKAMLWGIYEKATDVFHIDDACEYNANYLSETLKIWQKNGYKYAANQTKNRFSKRIALNLFYGSEIKEMESIFGLYKNIISYNYFLETIESDNPFKIRASILDEFAPDTDFDSPDFKRNYRRLKKDAETEVSKIETKIKTASSYQSHGEEYAIIRARAVEIAIENGLNKNYANLYFFVLALMDDSEYRAAKYISVMEEKKMLGREINPELLEKMHEYLNESFLFAWLNHVTNSKDLQINMAEQIVSIYERMVNYSDSRGVELINKISNSFMAFISKSEFSKRTLVKKLKPCYTPNYCDGIDCPVFDHGHTLVSSYDYDIR